jgi:hypothetical protein
MKQLLHYYANSTVGLGAYFAYQVGIGPHFGAYAKPLGLYYAVLHFIVFF